jgi:HK97 family phage major capsid protein
MTLQDMREALGRAVDKLGTEAVIADEKLYEQTEREIDDLQGQIDRASRAQTRAASLARPVGHNAAAGEPIIVPASISLDGIAPPERRRNWQGDDYVRAVRQVLRFEPNPELHFLTFGEQLVAVANAALSARTGVPQVDPRLQRAPKEYERAGSELDAASGGFLVQTDFSTAVFARVYDMGEIISRVRKLSLSTNANSIKIPGVDETSRATGSRWGGVQSYWAGEGQSVTSTNPKFRLIELDLKKLFSTWQISDELLTDASVVNSIANEAFSEEITFMSEDSIFRGDGAGKPLGFLNSPSLITVAKQTGQASKTILYENVLGMWSRCWARSRRNAVWLINQDNEPQLFSMSQVIGTAGVPVYMPAGGISGSPYATLFNRPVIATEYSSTVGTVGDITLVDMSQYVLADKGGVQAASSMHVAFLTDQMTFRITYRLDGEPIWQSALTPYQGTNTLSPFIALAAR